MYGYAEIPPFQASDILSGSVGSGDLGPAVVFSGNIASGQVGNFHIASGQVLGLLGVSSGIGNISSGTFTGFELGSGSIVSGRIASGQVGFGHLANGAVQSGSILSGNVAREHLASGVLQAGISTVIDGGGSALASGIRGSLRIPYNSTITNVNLLSDQSGGSVFLGIWKGTYATFPTTAAGSITTSGVPLVSGAVKSSYSGTAALSGWTTSLDADDILTFVVLSGATMTQVSVGIGLAVRP